MQETCKGVTRKGTRCKITQNLVNGYCRIHSDQGTAVTENEKKTQSVEQKEPEGIHMEPVQAEQPAVQPIVKQVEIAQKKKAIVPVIICLFCAMLSGFLVRSIYKRMTE